MISVDQIERLVQEKLGEGTLFLVQVKVNPGNKIVIEIDGDSGVGIDDCVAVSRQVESNLDREVEDFELPVTSAGLGQPFKVERQYHKNVGREVDLRLSDGSEKRGHIVKVNGGLTIKLPAQKKKQLPEREETYAWDQIKECKVRISFK
ncbi:MAG: ribosome assembly cofactor RimP [Flavobacteriales bacterium]